jgi:hypothetical protein
MIASMAPFEAVIQRWNDQLALGRDMLWSPTIRAALIAGRHGSTYSAQAVARAGQIDLRKVDRHPLASVATLVLGLRRSWCPELGADAQDPRFARAPRPQQKAVVSNL